MEGAIFLLRQVLSGTCHCLRTHCTHLMVLGHTCGWQSTSKVDDSSAGGRNRLDWAAHQVQVEVEPGAVRPLPLFAPPDDDLLVTLEQ